jgi:succinyl-CoA synthetase beta subunit
LLALDAKMNMTIAPLTPSRVQGTARPEEDRSRRGVEVQPQHPADGTIGCTVNGAGLAMATMDIIKLAGVTGEFPRRRRWRQQEQIRNAFKILMADRTRARCSSISLAASCDATCSLGA